MITIKSPVNGYNGVSAGVKFSKGIAEVEKLQSSTKVWFIKKGYEVIDSTKSKEVKEKGKKEVQ